MPLVSVIIPNYNGEDYIADAMQSVLQQRFSDFELIVVDDCSTDNSVEKIKSVCDERVFLIQNEVNQGPHISRNIALEKARGKYIALLDGDDLMLPNRLSKQVRYLERNPHIGILHSGYSNFGSQKSTVFAMRKNDRIAATLFRGCPICNSTVMFRAKIGLRFDPDFSRSEDYNMWCNAITAGFAGISRPLVKRRNHAQQISHVGSYTQQLSNEVNKKLLKRCFPSLQPEQLLLYQVGRVGCLEDKEQLQKLHLLLSEMIKMTNKTVPIAPRELAGVFCDLLIMACARSMRSGLILNPFRYTLAKWHRVRPIATMKYAISFLMSRKGS